MKKIVVRQLCLSAIVVFSSLILKAGDLSEYWIYISSYESGGDHGIGVYSWNPEKRSLSPSFLSDAVKNSSYLTVDSINNRLYSVYGNAIHGFLIKRSTGELVLIDSMMTSGRGGAYISQTSDMNHLMVAYYRSSAIGTYKLEPTTGSIASEIVYKTFNGNSVNLKRQEASHPHMIYQRPNSNKVLVPDLGTDQLMFFDLHSNGHLTQSKKSGIKLEPGMGPRHIDFHPQLPYVFLLAELSGDVVAMKLDINNDIGHIIDTQSILPENYDQFNKSADILVSKDGRFLYASNRGHDSIAICEIDPLTGEIALKRIMSSGGNWPRALAIDPTGDFLLVANKRSNNIVVFEINHQTGDLTEVMSLDTLPNPQCIRFIKK
ncbi:lactonase family protein [Reichenbachiella ulvae]|uniref:Lactonase family protein n=1 Tax=Reichenbachiella ulvae TaxID=2980104 RepID=A0ABT3CSL8_9BACT|nr:lactonase family protein [Reichenbachiella ulvae]MCV9386639.1 lactonase family protein [Reichenbachiella ulvae]